MKIRKKSNLSKTFILGFSMICFLTFIQPVHAGKKSKTSRTARFGLRATLQQEALLRKAAKITGKNITQFVLTSACEAAEYVLCDQKLFFADDKSFQAFEKILERPAQIKPKLRKLMKSRAPWEK